MARAKKTVNPNGFYSVYNWMLVDLRLKGSKLLVYAFIYAYSTNESGKGCYFGGNEAIAQSTGFTTRMVVKTVQELSNEGLIEIQQAELENGLKRNYYRVSPKALEPLKDLSSSVADGLKVIKAFSKSWGNIKSLSKAVISTEAVSKRKKAEDRVF